MGKDLCGPMRHTLHRGVVRGIRQMTEYRRFRCPLRRRCRRRHRRHRCGRRGGVRPGTSSGRRPFTRPSTRPGAQSTFEQNSARAHHQEVLMRSWRRAASVVLVLRALPLALTSQSATADSGHGRHSFAVICAFPTAMRRSPSSRTSSTRSTPTPTYGSSTISATSRTGPASATAPPSRGSRRTSTSSRTSWSTRSATTSGPTATGPTTGLQPAGAPGRHPRGFSRSRAGPWP